MGFRLYLQLLLTNRNYRSLFNATAISLFGDWFNLIAVVTLLGQYHGAGAQALGIVFIIRQIPVLLLSPISGVLADRFSRKNIMVASDLARFLIVLGFLLSPLWPSVYYIYGLSILQASFSAFFEPARSAITPDIVAPKDLGAANAVGSMLWSSMLVIGSALGGTATELFGWQSAIIIDAISYLVSAWFLSRVSYQPSFEKSHSAKLSDQGLVVFFSDLKSLLEYFRATPRVLLVSSIKGIYGIGGAMYLLLTLFGQQVFSLGTSGAMGVSLLYIARGSGALCGPFIGRAIFKDSQSAMRRGIFVALLAIAASYMSLALSPRIEWAFVSVFFGHMAGSIVWVFSTLLIQLEAEPNMRGRVFGYDLGSFTLSSCASTLIYGELIERKLLSVPQATFIMGALWVLPAVLWLWAQKYWREKQ